MNSMSDNKNIADIGDLIRIRGEDPGRLFEVVGWTHEMDYQIGYTMESIIYDVYDIETEEYAMAFQEDVEVIERSAFRPEQYVITPDLQLIEPTYDGPSVDELLDDLRDALELRALFGDEKYRRKVDKIKDELQKRAEADRNER